MRLTYSIITPARDEAENLRRLADCLVAQVAKPTAWVIVDDGSADETLSLVASLAQEHPWIQVVSGDGGALERGGPIVRAFKAGLAKLEPMPDVVVKVDADISVKPDHFERLVSEFELNPRLGVASGTCYEIEADGEWRQRHVTGLGVWAACRAYRHECLADILPFEERMGWDTLDLVKAKVMGWETKILFDLGFRHHRPEGKRDGHSLRTWTIQGEASHYMDYRVSYLFARTLFQALRNPAAVGLIAGYTRARVRRQPRCPDSELRAYVRRQQRLRNLPLRAREAMRPRAVLDRPQ
jgi:glycosyltransferase involved in cell wall biosynthesis